MNKGIIIGLGLAAGAALLLGASTSKASSKGFPSLPLPPGIDAKTYYSKLVFGGGDPKTWGGSDKFGSAFGDIGAIGRPDDMTISAQFGRRFWYLSSAHADAKPSPDKYSRSSVLVYRWPNASGYQAADKVWGWYWSDEYGRPYEGWGTSQSLLAMAVQIVQYVLPFIPGVGSAASASIAACIALSQGKSLKDAGLAAARASLPPEAQVAFDAGVGVASGQSIDDATKQALFKQVPGGKQAYNQGAAIVKSLHG